VVAAGITVPVGFLEVALLFAAPFILAFSFASSESTSIGDVPLVPVFPPALFFLAGTGTGADAGAAAPTAAAAAAAALVDLERVLIGFRWRKKKI